MGRRAHESILPAPAGKKQGKRWIGQAVTASDSDALARSTQVGKVKNDPADAGCYLGAMGTIVRDGFLVRQLVPS